MNPRNRYRPGVPSNRFDHCGGVSMPIVVSSPSSELLIYCQRHITDTPTPSGPKQRISNAKQISTQTPKDTLPINTTRVQLSLSILSGKKKKTTSAPSRSRNNDQKTNLAPLLTYFSRGKTTSKTRPQIILANTLNVSAFSEFRKVQCIIVSPFTTSPRHLVTSTVVHSLTNVRI
jgi:hypothetical protein